MIFTSVFSIISKKNVLSTISIVVFLLSGTFLFFYINSFICGIFQFITTFLLIFLFIMLYKTEPEKNNNLFKTKRFWAGIIIILLFIIIAGLLTYYCLIQSAEGNFFIPENKAVMLPYLSALITLKSVFADYILSFIYIILIFLTSICAILLLIKRKSKGEKND